MSESSTRRVFVTGSTTGLGRAAAEALIDDGHEVVVHARTQQRAEDLADIADRVHGVVVGDLADLDEVRRVAAQANALGPFDAVIHNAGIYLDGRRVATRQGHAQVVAVNVLAPYVLSALIDRPSRLVYLSSEMHFDGSASLDDIDWTTRPWRGEQAYCDSKLLITAFTLALARRWPDVACHAVDPGWVPTRMGGPNAPDDLVAGHTTQTWLAVGDDVSDPSGSYWHHRRALAPATAARDVPFQDALLERLRGLTGVALP